MPIDVLQDIYNLLDHAEKHGIKFDAIFLEDHGDLAVTIHLNEPLSFSPLLGLILEVRNHSERLTRFIYRDSSAYD